MECIKELTKEKNWAILDVEYIQISREHRCIRKLYLLAKNGFTESEMEFYPCIRYRYLDKRYQRSFHYCKKHIHKLSYNPEGYATPCDTALEKIGRFIDENDIDIILYKGGEIEKELCSDLGMPSYNIECIKELEKVHSHDPRTEVNCYFTQLVELDYM